MQVGLGTARNFSSTRPIFQNLAQNVPVAGRAFWEADWDVIKMRDECRVKMGKENGPMAQAQTKEMIKPTNNASLLFADVKSNASLDSTSEDAAEFERYFPTTNPATAGLTTYLLIPLAPTPTSRLPLSASPLPSDRLIPLPELASLHYSHSTHSLRVSSLFARLDSASVWHKGVSCDAYSSGRHSTEGRGVCTILRVSFAGWSAAEVRSVIGESGSGWCELYEANTEATAVPDVDSEDDASEMDAFSEADSHWAPSHDGGALEDHIDPSQSFVLPTLDFSSSFLASASSSPPTPASEIDMFSYAPSPPASDADWDLGSDGGSAESWVHPTSRASSRFGFGFSSAFAGRLGEENRV
ncbi:hypothetical protein HWV62_35450 [Athelia sp. TMB]|nr:hypothetical protein HWV62_35450 [Athelia sp. TMB]